MAFVRTKKVKGKEYRYLVESYRTLQGQVRQRTIKYLGPVADGEEMVTTKLKKNLTFEEYLQYDDGTNNRYELVNGELVFMPPASFLHSDILDFLADCFKAYAREYKLDLKVKTGDVGVRTGMKSSRIPDISVIDGQVWKSYRRESAAVIEDNLMLAVEVVSPGSEQRERDYTEKVAEYQETGIPEYWIVDPIERKIAVLVLERGSYTKTVFTGNEVLSSPTFPELQLTADAILSS